MQFTCYVYHDFCDDHDDPRWIGKGVVSSKRIRAHNTGHARKKFVQKYPNYKILGVSK